MCRTDCCICVTFTKFHIFITEWSHKAWNSCPNRTEPDHLMLSRRHRTGKKSDRHKDRVFHTDRTKTNKPQIFTYTSCKKVGKKNGSNLLPSPHPSKKPPKPHAHPPPSKPRTSCLANGFPSRLLI